MIIVGNSRNNDVANPDIHVFFIQILSKSQNAFIRLGSEFFVLFRVNMFDIKHHQVCQRHQFIQFGKPFGIGIFFVGNTGGINACVHIGSLRNGKQINQKVYLHQGLAAGDSDAAAFVKCLIAFILLKNIFRFH